MGFNSKVKYKAFGLFDFSVNVPEKKVNTPYKTVKDLKKYIIARGRG